MVCVRRYTVCNLGVILVDSSRLYPVVVIRASLLQQTVPLEDLNQLDDWNKATIAAHLHKRFKVQRPYTSLGNIVVAVNPFEWLDLYDDDLGLAYQEPGRRDLPAHIYKSTAGAYR